MPYANPEVKRAKQAEYRARNRARLSAAAAERNREIKAAAPEAFLAKRRHWRALRVAEGRCDREAEAANARARYQIVKGDPEFKAKNVARAVEWRRSLDLNAPENIQRRLACRLRGRLRKALRRGPKTASAVKDLGCSVAGLIEHLERQFRPGMTWDNYSEWHIDHIAPLASFDLTDDEQARQACHYTNLQPLWAVENQRKHARVTLYAQALEAQ